jgi:hypothetical protein
LLGHNPDRYDRVGFTLVHPDDHHQHELQVHAAVDRRRGYRSSFRIVNPATSAVVWIEERAEAIDRGAFDPPQLIGLAFDATVRRDRSAPTSLLATLAAAEEFGDVLLLLHAGARRHPSRPRPPVIGEWVAVATQALADLAALLVMKGSGAVNIIGAETKALRTRLAQRSAPRRAGSLRRD